MDFEWDEIKNKSNIIKHKISFEEAQYAFADTKRVIAIDHKHSTNAEIRYFCYGMLDDRVITVRFTYRAHKIRIFGAGYWREGYEKYFKEKRKEN
ncbi:MAG: BrnT family toxin [Leptonema sp. (in: Bacteria)]|nr:BrnT family toxin [Leptonema sp. (in: bacteria)]